MTTLTDLPKTPDEAFALGAARAFQEARDLLYHRGHDTPRASILEKLEARQREAEARLGDFYSEGSGDHVNRARHMLLALEMLGVEGLDGACEEAKGGYYFILRAISEHLEAADESFRGYLHREPFELEDQEGRAI